MKSKKEFKELPKELIKPSNGDTFHAAQIIEFMCRENDDATNCRVNYAVGENEDILF